MEKLVYARDGKELSGAVTVNQMKRRPSASDKLKPITKRRNPPSPPPPKGAHGHIP
ncbi:hypothetical protein FH972_019122 [Carpinus fangiana]|uniref:Uncharacterized protein n=1 Tax=Carpinus fangiana TaxID=176857 RepID=A0A5N6RQP7_9ROSI|nr:hypothetical protein FH972_019122 [Carpinus fangiana]